MVATPVHERAGRSAKVASLLAALYVAGIPVAAVPYLHVWEWAKVAEAAGCRPPSSRTVNELLALLHQQSVRGSR